MTDPRDIKNLILAILFFFVFLPLLSSGSKMGIIVIIAFAVYFLLNKYKEFQSHNQASNIININKYNSMVHNFLNNTKKLAVTFVVAVLLIWLLASSIIVVDAGYTGVYSLFGKVGSEEFASGIHLINPLAKITPMSIRTEEYTMSLVVGEGKKRGADAITALTKEGLNVDLDITVLYHLQQDRASDIYKDVGLDYEEKVIRPEIRSAIREIIAQYEAKDIYSDKRKEAEQKIEDNLQAKLNPRGIELEDVLLRNVKLPANLANAIQEKLQAEQEAQKYDFILDKEKKEAERKVIEAEGQKDAQRIINESLTTNYLYYSYISQLKDREGTIYVPTSPSTGMPLFRNLGK